VFKIFKIPKVPDVFKILKILKHDDVSKIITIHKLHAVTNILKILKVPVVSKIVEILKDPYISKILKSFKSFMLCVKNNQKLKVPVVSNMCPQNFSTFEIGNRSYGIRFLKNAKKVCTLFETTELHICSICPVAYLNHVSKTNHWPCLLRWVMMKVHEHSYTYSLLSYYWLNI